MKYCLLVFLFSPFTFLAQNTAEALTYMEKFSVESERLQQDMWDYTRTVSNGKSAKKVDKRRFELIESCAAAHKKAKAMGAFDGSTRYRDSVVHFFNIYEIVLREDYAKIVDMEEVAEQSYDLMEAYMLARELANEKLAEAGEMVGREQELFAEANNITLIDADSELKDKMEIANQVYEHYNAVYLIFFKSYKQEAYMLDALSSNDMSAIEQNRLSLISVSDEGLDKLKTVELYKEDKSLVEMTNEILKFYKHEAENFMVIAIEYLTAKEEFTKIKTAFDSKKEKDRTQADVDEFNTGVEKVNKALNNYNAVNASMNKQRQDMTEKWNATGTKFTSKHIANN